MGVVGGIDGPKVEEQRIVLSAAGGDEEGGWSGIGKARGAPGYVAVVSVQFDGHTVLIFEVLNQRIGGIDGAMLTAGAPKVDL